MALPTLQTNKYTLILPSTGKKVEYRPFLVKEEKLLLIAQETDDQELVIKSVIDVIDACTFNKLDMSELTTYDIEYIFIQLRRKSVDESAQILTKCPHCKNQTPITIDLENAKVVKPKETPESHINLTDDGVGIILKPLSLDDAVAIADKQDDFNAVLLACIESIYDSEKVYQKEDHSQEELNDFIDSFSRKNIQDIEHYITNQPAVKYNEEHVCALCNKTFEVKLAGLQDFFV
jgi:hypothetical protein